MRQAGLGEIRAESGAGGWGGDSGRRRREMVTGRLPCWPQFCLISAASHPTRARPGRIGRQSLFLHPWAPPRSGLAPGGDPQLRLPATRPPWGAGSISRARLAVFKRTCFRQTAWLQPPPSPAAAHVVRAWAPRGARVCAWLPHSRGHLAVKPCRPRSQCFGSRTQVCRRDTDNVAFLRFCARVLGRCPPKP